MRTYKNLQDRNLVIKINRNKEAISIVSKVELINKSNCVGIYNSMYGLKKYLVQIVNKYINDKVCIYYKYRSYQSLPSIVLKACTGKGRFTLLDKAKYYKYYIQLRKKRGVKILDNN